MVAGKKPDQRRKTAVTRNSTFGRLKTAGSTTLAMALLVLITTTAACLPGSGSAVDDGNAEPTGQPTSEPTATTAPTPPPSPTPEPANTPTPAPTATQEPPTPRPTVERMTRYNTPVPKPERISALDLSDNETFLAGLPKTEAECLRDAVNASEEGQLLAYLSESTYGQHQRLSECLSEKSTIRFITARMGRTEGTLPGSTRACIYHMVQGTGVRENWTATRLDSEDGQMQLQAVISYLIASCLGEYQGRVDQQPGIGNLDIRKQIDCLIDELGAPEVTARQLRQGLGTIPLRIFEAARESCISR